MLGGRTLRAEIADQGRGGTQADHRGGCQRCACSGRPSSSQGDETRVPREHEEVRRAVRRRHQGRHRGLGGSPPEDRGRGQRRQRPRHRARLVRRPAQVRRQVRSISPTSPPISARSMAAGIRWPRSTAAARRRQLDRACRSAPRAGASSIASPGSTRPASRPIPTDLDGFLELCQEAEEERPSGRLRPRQRRRRRQRLVPLGDVGPGGAVVDEQDKVIINSKETIEALKYAKALARDLHPAARSPGSIPRNNKAFLAGESGPDAERHLGLLRGQELAGSDDQGDGRGHLPRPHADRPGRPADRAGADRQLRWSSTTPSTRTRPRNICAS